MNKAQYPIVTYSLCEEDGGGFIALAPDLIGCMGDGATPAEAIACLYDAMDEWADEVRRVDRPIPAAFSLSDKRREDELALRKLVDAQAELVNAQADLIKQHERALASQNTSLNELRGQVDVLTASLQMNANFGLIHTTDIGRCRQTDAWLRGSFVEADADLALPIKRSQLSH